MPNLFAIRKILTRTESNQWTENEWLNVKVARSEDQSCSVQSWCEWSTRGKCAVMCHFTRIIPLLPQMVASFGRSQAMVQTHTAILFPENFRTTTIDSSTPDRRCTHEENRTFIYSGVLQVLWGKWKTFKNKERKCKE